ncbi:SpoIIIAH-like family protein [Paenibacillus sp. 7541]|uniref:SpoIIIAH-like family protein n=1 Tax=Paenibacillus sp. 7541 TaxID=2026236 RepID=UPI000BA55B4E|nr:SpoIIIAH-like family protein [Paenibacillus sp. 7541]PAK53485.1 mutants block sporulation after engulfment (stage III sporulation) [Paenibacillus sp. 7541]
MNNKRQTIWLVSMLSLMVVLSAYYLFTDDPGSTTPPVADSTQADGAGPGVQGADGTGNPDELVINEIVEEGASEEPGTAPENAESTGTETGEADADSGAADADTSAAEGNQNSGQSNTGAEQPKTEPSGEDKSSETSSTTGAKTEKEILEEVAAQAGTSESKIEAYKMERTEKNMKLYDELMARIGNQDSTPEELAKASEQMRAAEEREAVIESIEVELQEQFGNAVVKEENDRYNVVVLTNELDAKGAAGIVTLVMKELKVSPDKVTVQYVSP